MKINNPNRTCLITGEEKPQELLLRFTLTPDCQVIPDFKKRLSGKGFYISNSKQLLTDAINKNVFRKLGKSTSIIPNLVEIVENILKNKALDSINLANKAGDLVCGLDKIKEKLSKNQVAFLLQAENAGGRRKQTEGHALRKDRRYDRSSGRILHILEYQAGGRRLVYDFHG